MRRLAAICILFASALVAQTNRGSIGGTVTDATGAVVPGATVTITSLGTNETRKANTSENGTFTVLDLEPVTYRVEVEATGFKHASVDNVKVDTASNATVNVRLETGSIDTKVTVEAEAVMVDTSSGTSSAT